MPIRVGIVENEESLLYALQLVINSDPGFACIGAFNTGEKALASLPALNPDIVLMDIDLGKGMNGIECIAVLKPLCPNAQFMVLTIFEDYQKVFDALSAGALGYVLKSASQHKILEAVRDLYEGGAPMSPSIARQLALRFAASTKSNAAEAYSLTAREKEVIGLIAKGKIEKEVAAELFLSLKTVKTHISNIYEKLQVHTRVEALNKYFGR
jgi:DNA-binding NarL/FixJ family response regulator